MTDMEPSFPERAVARLAATLDRSRPKRRSFLAGLAVAGSALAVKPWGFLIEDAAAYDVVCGDDNECSDGWTAFCCTVSGTNSCPPGSFPAGWWKADNAGFCCGSARYYIDCNATCGSDWQCHCASGTCDRRRVACNQFRYGQCHQEIACYGPVVCRVVTCEPPWEWSSSCTSLSLTDNRTVTHSAPCLSKDCGGPVEDLWHRLGGAAGVLGARIAAERPAPPRGSVTLYEHGAIYRIGSTVHEVHGSLWSWYCLMGNQTGVMGYPVANTATGPDGRTRYSVFEHGLLSVRPGQNPVEIHGALFDKWKATGQARGALGLPTTSARTAPDGYTPYCLFDTGAVFARLGHGTIEIHGAIFTKWQATGGTGLLGMPLADTATGIDGTTRISRFDNGAAYYRPGLGTYETHGAIANRWQAIDGAHTLGYPIGDTATDDAGRRYSSFDRGRIVYDPVTKTTTVVNRSFKTPTVGGAKTSGPTGHRWPPDTASSQGTTRRVP